MAVNFDYRIVLLILSTLSDLVESTHDGLYGTSQSHFGRILPRFNQSKMLAGDISSILSTMRENNSLYFHLIYDQHYEDTASDIEQFSKELDGTIIFEYQEAIGRLSLLLIPVSSTTLLLTLCSTSHILKIFEMVRDQQLESHLVSWFIVLEEEEHQDEVIFGLEGLIHEGTQVTLFIKDKLQNFNVFSSRVDLDGVVRFFNTGNWKHTSDSKRSHLHDLMMPDVEQQYSDMKGRELILAGKQIFPFFVIGHVLDDGTVKPNSGLDIILVETLSTVLNFTYRIVRPADDSTGTLLPNGTWTGLIGMVAHREANFAIGVLGISGAREKVIDFTTPYIYDQLTICSRAPALKNRAFAVLSPFTLQVWICITVSTLALGPILLLQSKVMGTYLKKENSPTWGLQVYSFSIFRNLILQGNILNIIHWPHRFIFYFWYLFCLMVSASYSGMLTAVFAVPAYETPVDSLQDLSRAVSEGFTIGVFKESTNEDLFKFAKEGIYKEVWDLFNHEDRSKSFVNSISIGIFKVLKEKFVMILPKTHMLIITTIIGKRKFHMARQLFYPQSVGIAFPTGSPIKEKFNYLIHRLVDGGLVNKWNYDEIERVGKRFSDGEGPNSLNPLTITHLQAAFFIFVLGHLVAATTLALECVHSFCKH